MSRFVGFAYPDGLYILDTLTGKVTKVPTAGQGPAVVQPALSDEPSASVTGSHEAIRYPHTGVPYDVQGLGYALDDGLEGEADDTFDPVSEAIARLGAEIPPSEPSRQDSIGTDAVSAQQLDDAGIDEELEPTGPWSQADESDLEVLAEPGVDLDTTQLGVPARSAIPRDETFEPAAVLREPPPPGWPARRADEERDRAQPSTRRLPDKVDPDEPWARESGGHSTDRQSAFSIEPSAAEPDLDDVGLTPAGGSPPTPYAPPDDENPFGRSAERRTGRSPAPWLDPTARGAPIDEAFHRAPTASHRPVPDEQPGDTQRRPVPKTDPGVPQVAFGRAAKTPSPHDTHPGLPMRVDDEAERAVPVGGLEGEPVEPVEVEDVDDLEAVEPEPIEAASSPAELPGPSAPDTSEVGEPDDGGADDGEPLPLVAFDDEDTEDIEDAEDIEGAEDVEGAEGTLDVEIETPDALDLSPPDEVEPDTVDSTPDDEVSAGEAEPDEPTDDDELGFEEGGFEIDIEAAEQAFDRMSAEFDAIVAARSKAAELDDEAEPSWSALGGEPEEEEEPRPSIEDDRGAGVMTSGDVDAVDPDRPVLVGYPYPVAISHLGFVSASSPAEQGRRLAETFAALLRLWTYQVLAQYLAEPDVSDVELDHLLRRRLGRPALSDLCAMLDRGLTTLRAAEVELFCPELAELWERIAVRRESSVTVTLASDEEPGRAATRVTEVGLVDALLHYCGTLTHGEPVTDELARMAVDTYGPVLRHLLTESAFAVEYPLFAEEVAPDPEVAAAAALDTADLMRPDREPGAVYAHRLMGAVPASEPEAIGGLADDAHTSPVFMRSRATGRVLPLGAFFELAPPTESEQVIPGLGRELFLLAGRTPEAGFFVSPAGLELERREAGVAWRERLAALTPEISPRLGPEVTRSDLAQAASALTRGTLGRLRAWRIVLDEAAIERVQINERLVAFDYGDYRGFVLGGHSGAGKTSLLAQLADVRLERGDVVLFYLAAELDGVDLATRIMTDLGLPELPLSAFLDQAHDLFRPELPEGAPPAALEVPRLFVLVDGVHEHPSDPAGLVDAIDAIVASAAGAGWFRLVASVRSSRYAHLPLASRFGRTEGSRYLTVDLPTDAGWDRTPVIELPSLTPAELRQVYERYRSWRPPSPVDGLPGVAVMRPRTPYGDLDATGSTCAMMRRPLLLRLALAAFHRRELPSGLTYAEVLGSYLDQVVAEEDSPEGAFPQRRAFLTALVREMDGRSRAWVERDSLYDVPGLGDALRRTGADSPYTQLLDLGVLVETWVADRWVVRLAAERLFEFLLAKHLEVGLDSAADVWALARRADELPNVRGALRVVLLQAAKHGRRDLLTESLARIDEGDDSGADRLEAGVITDAVVDVLEHLAVTRDEHFGSLLPAVTPEARRPMIETLLLLFDRLMREGAVQGADPVAHRAVLLSEELGEAELLSRALSCRARREEQRGDVEAALATYAQTLEAGHASGDTLREQRINAHCGVILREHGLSEHALDLLDQAAAGLEALGARREAARARFEQGELLGEQGDLQAEIERTLQALALAEGGADRGVEARSLGKLAWLYLRSGSAGQGLAFQERAQVVAEAEGDLHTLSSMHNLRGLVSWDQDFDAAAQSFVESRHLAQRLGDHRALMVASSNLADLRLLQGHLEEAERLVRSAIKLARELKDREQEAWNLGKLSKVALEAGTLTQAQSLAEEALTKMEALGSERGKAWTLGYLAEVGLEHGQMDVARTLVKRAVEISEASGEMVNLTWLWDILGRSNVRLHRLEAAETHFKHIRAAGENVASPYAVAAGLVGLADCEARRGHWSETGTLLEDALERLTAVGSPAGISRVERRLGGLLLAQSRYDEALPHLEQAFEVAQSLANPRLWAKAHQALAELLKEQGRIGEAKRRARQALEIRKILDHPLELAESWATVGVCHDLDDQYDEASGAFAQARRYAEAVDFEPAIAFGYFLSASQAIDRGLDAPVGPWAERLVEMSRRTTHPVVKAVNAALSARIAALGDDEFKLHNALLDVESAYALLPGHVPVELSPASAYHDAAYFYLSRGRPRRCKEMTKLCRAAAGSRPYPRMAELRKLPSSDHTADFEAISLGTEE